MKQNVELLASYWTIAGGAMPHTDKEYSPFDFKDRVEAAARAGFKGVESGIPTCITFSNAEV